MQSGLIQQIDGLIQRVYEIAAIRDNNLGPKRIPYRQLQAVILTSAAFFDMSHDDAADVMGTDVSSVYNHIYRARKDSNTSLFLDMWTRSYEMGSLHSPFDIAHIDETRIERVF
jgi:hypothetical protein